MNTYTYETLQRDNIIVFSQCENILQGTTTRRCTPMNV